MNTKEKAELMLWWQESQDHIVEIQAVGSASEEWEPCSMPGWDWVHWRYRKRVAPRRVWLNFYAHVTTVHHNEPAAPETVAHDAIEVAVPFVEVLPDEE